MDRVDMEYNLKYLGYTFQVVYVSQKKQNKKTI